MLAWFLYFGGGCGKELYVLGGAYYCDGILGLCL